MRPFKFQHAHLRKKQLWIFLMVSISWIVAFEEAEGDKTFNLKIGFDLSPGARGSSALRTRNFEDGDNAKRALRAETSEASSSNSNENEKKKEIDNPSVEMKAADSSSAIDDSEDSDGDGRPRSTKGLRADEYDPQVGPSVREAFDKDSESENNGLIPKLTQDRSSKEL